VNTIRRISFAAILIILFAGTAAAEVEVTPGTLNESVTVGEDYSYEFTVSNTDENYSVRNVTLEETEWLNWSQTSFSINESSSVSVNASIQVSEPGQFNESLTVSYQARNTTDGNESNTSSGEWVNREDSAVDVFLDSSWPSTDVEVDVFQSSYELQFGEVDNSVIAVQNNGNATARNVTLSGEDIRFSESGVDIPPGDDKIFEFNISLPVPGGNATAATNQSYSRGLQVSGENFQAQSANLSVFVPYKDYNEDQVSEEEKLRELYFEVCGSGSSNNLICRGTVVETETETRYINHTPESNVTLTDPELRAIKQYANQSPQRYTTLAETVVEQENLTRQQLTQTLNRTIDILEEEQAEDEQLRQYVREQERQEQRSSLLWKIFLVIVAIVAVSLYVVKIIIEKSDDTRM